MTKDKILMDNKTLFVSYGILNIALLAFLLTLLILLFNDLFVLSRQVYVIFIVVHIGLIYFVRINFLCIAWEETSQLIEITYNKNFGLRWKRNAVKVTLPLSQFDGYKIGKDNIGVVSISLFKLEKRQRFELGPFNVGHISAKSKKSLEEAFGESLA